MSSSAKNPVGRGPKIAKKIFSCYTKTMLKLDKKKIIILVSILALAAIAGGGYFVRLKINPGPNGITSKETPGDWKTYENKEFAFQFKYPPYASICITPPLHPEETYMFDLMVSMKGDCSSDKFYGFKSADILININNEMAESGVFDKGNIEYNFYRDGRVYGIDKSLNPKLGYINFDNFKAYGGTFTSVNSGKEEYLILISSKGHNISLWDKNYYLHSKETNVVLNSFHFSTEKYPR